MNKSLLEIAAFSPRMVEGSSAWLGHIPFAAWIIQETRPKVLVELGAHCGHSYFAFCDAIQEFRTETRSWAVDTWCGDPHSGAYTAEVYNDVREHNQKYYGDFSELLRMTFDEAAREFHNASIDVLHIDGFHTYEAARHDFDVWLPKVRKGGIVILHDICVRERDFGVWKLWDEIKAQYQDYVEFSHSYGLGVVQIVDGSDRRTQTWRPDDAAEKEVFTNYFSALGLRQVERYEIRDLKRLADAEKAKPLVSESALNNQEHLVTVSRLNCASMGGPPRGLSRALKDDSVASPDIHNSDEFPEAVTVHCVYGSRDRQHIETCLLPSLAKATRLPIRLFTMNYDPSRSERIESGVRHGIHVKDIKNEASEATGFATNHNSLFKNSNPAGFFVIINPDCIPHKHCIDVLISRKLRTKERAGIVEGRQWPHEHPKEYDPLSLHTPWASGAFSLIDAAFYRSIGGMDETYFLYMEDVDLSWQAWLNGYSVLYEPASTVTHFSSGRFYRSDLVSQEQYLSLRNFLILERKFFGLSGEREAMRLLDRHQDQELAKCALREYQEHFKGKVSERYEGRTHKNVKVLGLGQFHKMMNL